MSGLDHTLLGEYRFLPIDKVIFGSGVIEKLPEELKRLEANRVALITSKSLVKSSLVDQLKEVMGNHLVTVVTGTVQHVPSQSVFEVAQRVKTEQVDLLMSLGGGTVIDTVKAVALILAEGLTNPKQLKAYSVKFKYPDKVEIPSIQNQTLPHIAIPTTLSAAEFSNIIGITDEHRKVKELYIDDKLTPKSVFLDPQMTVNTPDWLWAATGIRALDHAIETIYSKQSQPVPTTLALESIRTLHEYLPKSKQNPNNLEARLKCQLAAWMSFFGVINVMMGLSHGIGHQIGAHANVPHGITSCTMLPHVLRFSLPVTQRQQAAIAAAMGADTSGKSIEEAASLAPELVSQLVKDLDLPIRLRDVGVSRDQFKAIAADAMDDLVVAGSPKPINGEEDVIHLLEKAW
jgi:alcohol dehydrogenase